MPDVVAWGLAPIVVITASLVGVKLLVAGRHWSGLVFILGTLMAVSEALILHSTTAAPSEVVLGDAVLLLVALASVGVAAAVLSDKLRADRSRR